MNKFQTVKRKDNPVVTSNNCLFVLQITNKAAVDLKTKQQTEYTSWLFLIKLALVGLMAVICILRK